MGWARFASWGYSMPAGWGVSVVAGLLALAWTLVASTGGAPNALMHLAYPAILVAALRFGPWGGLLAAVAATIALGPAMPGVHGRTFGVPDFTFRGLVFTMVGVFGGLTVRQLVDRAAHERHLAERLESTYLRTLATIAATVELRDAQTGGHCERVAGNARVLARALGLDEEAQRTVHWAGLLHDLGKIGVPEAVLNKPGRLTADELTVMRSHAALGAELLLGSAREFSGLAEIVRAHHEWWNGAGYPDRLSGEAIPLLGRLLSVVDVFEALTGPRPYREPMSTPAALEHIRRGAGSQFDPDVVRAFTALVASGDVAAPPVSPPAPPGPGTDRPPSVPAPATSTKRSLARRS
jgi:putative nucleotidyltransferase with HDIG domain